MVEKKKKKGGLAKRYQASYDNQGSFGSKAGVMNWKKVDREVEFFSPKEGRNRINIVPYEIKTKNHPLVKKGEFEIGDKDYVMDIFTHRGIGPSEATVLCLKETYGKPCPICEQAAMLKKQGKEKEAGALKASRRVFYNIQDCKNPDKLLVFEASHYLFEKELIEEARDDEEGGFVDFADEESGKEIKFRCSKVSKGGFEFNEYKSFSFEDRDENIPDELLESAISFDEIMNVPTYEEVEKILYGEDEDEDSDEDEKPSKKSKKVESDDEEDDFEEDEEPAPKKSKKKPEPEEDEEEDDSDEDDEEEEEEKPTPKKSVKKSAPESDDEDDWDDEDDEPAPKPKSKKKPEPEEDEDSDDSDDEEEEEPAPKKSKKKDCGGDCGKCPFGHKFGDDCDDFDDCDDCDIWDKCVNAK